LKIEKLLRLYTDEVIEGKKPNKEDYINRCDKKDKQELKELMNTVDFLRRNKDLLKNKGD
jgi:hypothetical protein